MYILKISKQYNQLILFNIIYCSNIYKKNCIDSENVDKNRYDVDPQHFKTI